ncbi:hypothetical protein [Enterococcus sp. DIV0187]|uniref:hypothetical protein n=1 Tax=Enterococcus sp. DIV0187 TaxID=2774644 RepID=UPI003F68801D
MERYSWMIILAVIAGIALIAFFAFLFKDMELAKKKTGRRKGLLLNGALLLIAGICIVLSIYLYFDIQEQLRILGNI